MSYLSVVLAALFWAGNFNTGKLVVRHLPPFTSAAIRFAIASIVVTAAYLATERVDAQAIRRHLAWYVVLGIIGVFGFNVLFFLGMRYTSPVNASLIVATNPLITVVLSSIALHEELRANQKAGLALSMLGVLFVITGGSWAVIRTMSVSIGDVLMLLACTCWAVYSVLVRRHLSDSSPLATTTLTILFGAVAMIPFAILEPRAAPLTTLPGSVWLGLLYMGIPGAVLAYLLWNQAVKALGPSKASLYYNLLPVFTMAVSIALGDSVAPAQVAGGAIVIGGCLLSQVRAIESPRIDAATRSHARAD